jgi:RND family efflux transporter MFP subunit
LATPGAPLLTIEDDAHYRLEAAVEESLLGKIRMGDPVAVSIDALGSEEWGGRVGEISPASDPASRSGIVKIDISAKGKKEIRPGTLRSGLFGKARFPAGQRTLVAIPAKAVVQKGQLQGAYVVDSANVVRLRLIQLGKTYGEKVEVLAGLREGEKILVAGLEKVQDGSRVEW